MTPKRLALAALIAAASACPAAAHPDPAGHSAFAAGLSHPLFGLDHVLAMVAVGLWAAMLGGRAVGLVPIAFVGAMIAGFLLAIAGAALPLVEPMILASVVVLGLGLAAGLRLPAGAGAALVGGFALFHGHAHGGEPGSATPLVFLLGFALATALLHALGIGFGQLIGRASGGPAALRLAGCATAAAGLGLALA